MTFTEKINLIMTCYNQTQQKDPKQIREENTNQPKDLIKLLVKRSINKNITLFAVDILSFIQELNETSAKTEADLRDIMMARERAKLFMKMILLGKEEDVHIPDFTTNDPKDAKRLKILMKKYPDVSFVKLLAG